LFINDNKPTIDEKAWVLKKTLVKKGANIGTGAVILGGVILGENCLVGAGAVVTKNVPANSVVAVCSRQDYQKMKINFVDLGKPYKKHKKK